MIKEIQLSSSNRNEFIDITSQVAEFAREIDDGIITVFVPHTTAAVTINESADPDVQTDLLMRLRELSEHPDYKHTEGNSDAHLKTSLFGSSERVIVKDGQLILGTWQAVYFCEFDGPRTRKIILQS